jgi:multicomponent Na+:H+ antiporter subunit D
LPTIQSLIPVYVLMVPLAAIVLIALFGRWPNLRETWTILAAVSMFLATVSMVPQLLNGSGFEYHLIRLFQGVDIAFRVDPLGICFAATASFLWIIVSFYSIGYMRSLHEHAQTRYYICFAIALLAAAGVAFAANLVTLFIFYEMLTLSTYPLVVHHEDEEAVKGARTYMVYLLGTSIAFNLPAIFLTYVFAHTLEFKAGGILAGSASGAMIIVIFVLFVAGVGKAALMPFHSWLPAAMVAPTPVSALLHAVAVVKAGVFTITRVVLFVFGGDLMSDLGLGVILAYVASLTIIVASVIALRQDNMKRRLAYSTVSQLSYIILGMSLLTVQGVTGGILHISMHAFGKITLFMCAGSILVASGKKNISEMKGIGRKMPLTMTAFFIGSLSVVGLPPCGGFLSKWYLALGCIEAGYIPLLVVLLVSSFLNAVYFLPIVYQAFFGIPSADDPYFQTAGIREGPVFSVAALGLTAAASIVLFFYPQPFMRLAGLVGRQMFGG